MLQFMFFFLLFECFLHFCWSDGAAVHGPEGPCQCAVDCGARSGGQERSQHQVRDHYFLTYTRLVHSCVCVPFRGCPVSGPAPELGPSDARRVTSPAKLENKRSRPVRRVCPLHDDVWRCAVFRSPRCFYLFSLSLLPLAPLLPAGWCMTSDPGCGARHL